MGYSAVAIGERMGHESTEITFRYRTCSPTPSREWRMHLRSTGVMQMPCRNEDRARPITIAFRVSPEMNETINLLVAASGMTKQDYIVSKLLDKEISGRHRHLCAPRSGRSSGCMR